MSLESRPEVPDKFSSFCVSFTLNPILNYLRILLITFSYRLRFFSSLYHREEKIEIYNFCEIAFFHFRPKTVSKTQSKLDVNSKLGNY